MGSGSSCAGPDNETIQATKETTKTNLTRLKATNVVIQRVAIWTSLLEDNTGATSGCFHTFITFACGLHQYGLEKFQEGISFKAIDYNERIKNAKCFSQFHVNIKAHELVSFIKKECKKEYSLQKSNCIHFAYEFGKEFIPSSNVFTKGFRCFVTQLGRLWKVSGTEMWWYAFLHQ